MLIGRILTGHWNDVEEYQSTTFTEEDLRSYLDVGEEEVARGIRLGGANLASVQAFLCESSRCCRSCFPSRTL